MVEAVVLDHVVLPELVVLVQGLFGVEIVEGGDIHDFEEGLAGEVVEETRGGETGGAGAPRHVEHDLEVSEHAALPEVQNRDLLGEVHLSLVEGLGVLVLFRLVEFLVVQAAQLELALVDEVDQFGRVALLVDDLVFPDFLFLQEEVEFLALLLLQGPDQRELAHVLQLQLQFLLLERLYNYLTSAYLRFG